MILTNLNSTVPTFSVTLIGCDRGANWTIPCGSSLAPMIIIAVESPGTNVAAPVDEIPDVVGFDNRTVNVSWDSGVESFNV